MVPASLDHTFRLDGESYRLVEWNRGGDRRIKLDYAMSLVATLPMAAAVPVGTPASLADPQVYTERVTAMSRQLSALIEVMDGEQLLMEATARECLREAPALFWETIPAPAGTNGTGSQRVTLEHVPRALWHRFAREVQVFRDRIFREEQAERLAADAASTGDAGALASDETLSPVFHGRAQ